MSDLVINKICISCPIGCHLVITKSEKEISKFEITGNRCPKGVQYAESEIFSPKRMVTTTVRLLNSELLRLPVKTDKPISKQLIYDVCDILSSVAVNRPIKRGDIIYRDILSTGIDIIACRTVN